MDPPRLSPFPRQDDLRFSQGANSLTEDVEVDTRLEFQGRPCAAPANLLKFPGFSRPVSILQDGGFLVGFSIPTVTLPPSRGLDMCDANLVRRQRYWQNTQADIPVNPHTPPQMTAEITLLVSVRWLLAEKTPFSGGVWESYCAHTVMVNPFLPRPSSALTRHGMSKTPRAIHISLLSPGSPTKYPHSSTASTDIVAL